MKKLLLITITLSLLGCEDNLDMQDNTPGTIAESSFPGQIPDNLNTFWHFMNNSNEATFEEVNDYYISDVSKYKGEVFYSSLQNMTIMVMMEKYDMLHRATPAQITFYIDELFNMKYTFLNTDTFYVLLQQKIGEWDYQKLARYSQEFFRKNKETITNLNPDINGLEKIKRNLNKLNKAKYEFEYYFRLSQMKRS